ncbi:hypothetical protein Bhyg_01183, partial [Pseudolycoriella hygida]
MSDVYGTESSSHPVFIKSKDDKNFDEVRYSFSGSSNGILSVVLKFQISQRIKRHVLENGLRVKEFFEDFDCLRCGYITKSQYVRGLDILGVSKLG